MRATILTCRDPFNPGRRDSRSVGRRRRIRALAPKTSLPHIAYLNGRVLLRAEWSRKVRDGDVVAFVVLPMGGDDGGSNPLQLVATIALAIYAPQLAGAMLGTEAAAIGLSAIGMSSQMFVAIAGAGITLAGNALISSAFAGRPSLPSPQQSFNAIGSPSPTYNLQAQGNAARLEAAIPVQYGRMMAYPDFAAQPYAEYAGNEQYLFELLCLGQGEYEIEAIRIEDTPITSFEEIEFEIIGPGESLTLFPAAVVTAPEVAGQEAEESIWLGPFVASGAGTEANTIAVDVVAPRGLFYANDSGGLDNRSISFTVEARLIDDDGDPLGSYVAIGGETLRAATNTPQRYSFRYAVSGGRYEVRLQRTSPKGGSTRYGDDLMWTGLRAYLPETTTWPGLTLIALRMRASNNLSGQAARKINVISTRKLPIYSESSWTAPQVTRSPAWAMADVLRADYGAGLADARIDIAQLTALAAVYASRGDSFDGRFDQTLTLWEALGKIGQAVRTKPYQQGGIVHFARDQAATVPVAMFGMRNISRGSFSVDYLMPTADTADSISAGYFDGSRWAWRRVSATLPSGTTAKPLKVDLFGVTGRDQAYREGMYLAAVNRYRRKVIKFATEMEGFIPSFGDLITISHDMPAWGTSGELAAKTHQNMFSHSNALSDSFWTKSASLTIAQNATAPDGTTTAWTLTDPESGNYSSISKALTLPAIDSSTWTLSFFVKKTTGGTSTTLAVNLYLDGGSPNVLGFLRLNTDTGAQIGYGGWTVSSYDANFWRCSRTLQNNSTNGTLQFSLYPATGTYNSGADSVAVTGSAVVCWFQFENGPLTDYAPTLDLAKTLYLSEPVAFGVGSHYIGLRKRDGEVSGPYAVTAGVDARQVIYSGTLDFTPYTGGAEERTFFAFGKGETWRQPARVVAVRPRGLYQVEIEAINEDASVHTAEDGATAPAAQYSALPSLFTAPVVSGLTVRSSSSDVGIALVSWQSAPGARYYVVDISSDGDSWTRVGETTGNNLSVQAVYGSASLLRVAAHGLTRGPFVLIAYSSVADYMWSATTSTLMWSATDTTPMWS